ncbi:MAG: hypothetical protein ACXVAX_04210 [Pseudobdellovibrio sp.]
MKKIFFVTSLVFSLSALAQLRGYQVSPCQYWTMNSSGSGYVCQMMPPSIFVAEGYSFANVIKAQDDRITQLEKDVAELKKICKPGGN